MNTAEKAPTSEDLRRALLERADAYAELARASGGKKMSLSTISVHCAGDGKFLPEIDRGGNFTVDRYQKAMDWFEANWPRSPVSRENPVHA